jgi:hypothetical protein
MKPTFVMTERTANLDPKRPVAEFLPMSAMQPKTDSLVLLESSEFFKLLFYFSVHAGGCAPLQNFQRSVYGQIGTVALVSSTRTKAMVRAAPIYAAIFVFRPLPAKLYPSTRRSRYVLRPAFRTSHVAQSHPHLAGRYESCYCAIALLPANARRRYPI